MTTVSTESHARVLAQMQRDVLVEAMLAGEAATWERAAQR